ncbi:MAG: hypothetical protein HPY57_00120 [Ignavibacteria bacterium]|nr:hypothetical protein [Ignavibacteria bacterium]
MRGKIKLALICTRGGHFEQLRNLDELYSKYNHFWITNKSSQTESSLKFEDKYYIREAHYKKPWQYISHIPKIIKIFLKERPTTILSTGSGVTCLVPFLLSIIFRIRFIYIDTFSYVKSLTKFGRFVYKLRGIVLVQWKKEKLFPRSIYCGPVFKNEVNVKHDLNVNNYIFVSLGTRPEPFIRMLQILDDLCKKKKITQKLIVQAGHTEYFSDNMDLFSFKSENEIEELIKNSSFVITQESAGIVTKCLKMNKKFIVMPRRYEFGELPVKSDMDEDLHYKLEELGYTKVVTNLEEMEDAIKHLDEIKTGFKFDNSLAIKILKKLIEG